MMLKNKKISIIGFGNQGFAWAMNLKDSGYRPKIALRTGSRRMRRAGDLGFEVINIKQAFNASDIICILVPDEAQRELFEKYGSDLDDGQSLVFAHGFNVLYGNVKTAKNIDLILVAPKGTGESLRELYVKDEGLPCLIAVERDSTGCGWETAQALAEGLGCHRAGIFKSTFKEETEINLFTEQALYLSVLPDTIAEMFNTLVESGYGKEASYLECLHKVKTMAELFYRNGLRESFEKVSSAARIGGIINRERFISESFRKELAKTLKEIQDGTFVKRFDTEKETGFKATKAYLGKLDESVIEDTGRKLRGRFFKDE